MDRPKVMVTNCDIPQIAIDLLKEKCEVVMYEDLPNPSKEELLAKVEGVDAIFWAAPRVFDKEVLDRAGPQMKIVTTMSAGINHFDIQEMKSRGVKLGHTPKVLDSSVAATAVYLALAAARRAHEGRLHIENGTWVVTTQWMLGQDIEGATVGIVGLGGIGQAIAKRLKAFDLSRILYCGHKEKREGIDLGAEFVPFDTLVRESDFVIVACPLTPETEGLFTDAVFNKMKNTSVFVNIARGQIVHQPALIKALKGGNIFAAGLDVMIPEPLPTNHELLQLPNCVLLPHLGSATVKTRNAMAETAAKNILNALEGKPMIYAAY